jgi:hypothetical protein
VNLNVVLSFLHHGASLQWVKKSWVSREDGACEMEEFRVLFYIQG